MIPALVAAGQLEQAAQAATGIPDPGEQARALIAVVQALVAAGQLEQAARVAGEAERAARSTFSQRPGLLRLRFFEDEDDALAGVVQALAAAGHLERAERVAGSMSDSWRRARALGRAVEALAAVAGQLEQATQAAASIWTQASGLERSSWWWRRWWRPASWNRGRGSPPTPNG